MWLEHSCNVAGFQPIVSNDVCQTDFRLEAAFPWIRGAGFLQA